MIQERYMVQAERVDNRETVQGYYFIEQYGKKVIYYIQTIHTDGTIAYKHEIDPTTIEPVAVKLIYEEEEYRCPNCDACFYKDGKAEDIFLEVISYCMRCGQRLDWEGL